MVLSYFLNYFEIGQIFAVVTGISFGCTSHMHRVSTVNSLCFIILITFLTPEIVSSITIHVPSCIISYYDIRFIVRDGSFGFALVNSII